MLRVEGTVSTNMSVCYSSSTQEEGQPVRVLPEGAFLCAGLELALRSRNGRPGNGRLALTLCSTPKAGAFELPGIKVLLFS